MVTEPAGVGATYAADPSGAGDGTERPLETRRTWQPLSDEPDPVERGVHEVIRLTLPALFAEAIEGPRRQPVASTRLADGRELLVEYAVAPAKAAPFNGRATVAYRLAGHAGTAGHARRFDGRAVVDVATGAFLDLAVTFETASAVRR